jgi:hypothetical protein
MEAYSIIEFCKAHAISRAQFYKLLHAGPAPRLMYVGCRSLISKEAAADWRREREAAYPTRPTPRRGGYRPPSDQEPAPRQPVDVTSTSTRVA